MSPFATHVNRCPIVGVVVPCAALAITLALCGCAGDPEIRAPQSTDAGENPPGPNEGHLTASSLKEDPLYSLASPEPAHSGVASESEGPTPAARSESRRTTATPVRPSPPDRFEHATENELVGELHTRWTRQWADLSGGLGSTPTQVDAGRRQEMAGKLVAMAFIGADHGKSDAALAQALSFLEQDESRRDLSLLAAALHEHQGEGAAVTRILGGLGYCPTPVATEASATDVETAPFEVVGLTFAAAIEGPGKFVPLDPGEVGPGKSVLIYGEFRNFTSMREPAEESPRPLYRRAFQATLRLVKDEDETVDRLEFLPEKRGRQVASTLSEVMNFWAKYRFPPDLKPGNYKLVVEAQDLLGSATAVAELSVEMRAP